MTNDERREARYQRRKAARRAKLQQRGMQLGAAEQWCTYRRLYRFGKACCKGVRYKQSIQNFERHLFSLTAARRREILDGTWKQRHKPSHFTLCERGKVRPIDAPHVEDRHVQKLVSKDILEPCYKPSMIYDNGASQTGKGLHLAYRRLSEQLRNHYRRHGLRGGVLLLDLRSFFPNAPKDQILKRHQELILSPSARELADRVVVAAPETSSGRGMPLGMEPSQQEMIALPSAVDNWLKCQRRYKMAGHYMDDYYVGSHDVGELRALKDELVERFGRLGITVNENKVQIVPMGKPFRFCKVQFCLTAAGGVKRHAFRDSAKRGRRKIRLLWAQGKAQAARDALVAHTAYYAKHHDHGRVQRLYGYYKQCERSAKGQ